MAPPAPELGPNAEPVAPVAPVLPAEPPRSMPGQGCPECPPGPGVPGAGAPRGAPELLGGCADEDVVWVVLAPLDDAGAAADTAIPPSAPAEASVPVITATLTAFEDSILE